jgi:hypothetical protein
MSQPSPGRQRHFRCRGSAAIGTVQLREACGRLATAEDPDSLNRRIRWRSDVSLLHGQMDTMSAHGVIFRGSRATRRGEALNGLWAVAAFESPSTSEEDRAASRRSRTVTSGAHTPGATVHNAQGDDAVGREEQPLQQARRASRSENPVVLTPATSPRQWTGGSSNLG